jgi:hypothetical protein
MDEGLRAATLSPAYLRAQWPVPVFVLTVQLSEFRRVARDSGTYSLGVKWLVIDYRAISEACYESY